MSISKIAIFSLAHDRRPTRLGPSARLSDWHRLPKPPHWTSVVLTGIDCLSHLTSVVTVSPTPQGVTHLVLEVRAEPLTSALHSLPVLGVESL
jgi:hypothetical protein